MAKEIRDKETKEISQKIAKLMQGLHKDGYNQPMSLILVMGGKKRGEVNTIPIINGNFINETLNALDHFIALVKVHGIPNPREAGAIMSMNKDGNIDTYEGEQAEAFLKSTQYSEIEGLLNEMYEGLKSEKDKIALREKILQGLIVAVSNSDKAWLELDMDVRMGIIADAILTLRTEHNLKMLETDYTDAELQKAIETIDYQMKFGYTPNKDRDMTGYQ